jgi:hypothetical protein
MGRVIEDELMYPNLTIATDKVVEGVKRRERSDVWDTPVH